MFITEIFESFHGEVNGHHQGRRVTFIRVSGCNLRCPYCDTKETWDQLNGENLAVPEIVKRVKKLGNDYVCLTGGEPLIDRSIVLELLWSLYDEGFHISVETNGTICIHPFFKYVESFVIDYKMHLVPSRKDNPEIRVISNFIGLRNTDVLKFLVKSEEEIIQASCVVNSIISNNRSDSNPIFAFSSLLPSMNAATLSKLLVKHNIRNSVLSLQMHKFIGFK